MFTLSVKILIHMPFELTFIVKEQLNNSYAELDLHI